MAPFVVKMPRQLRCMLAGRLHTGDLGVVHADSYIEIVDRAKNVIISGGENILSICRSDGCLGASL